MGDKGVPLFTYPVNNQNRLQYSIGEKKRPISYSTPNVYLPYLM